MNISIIDLAKTCQNQEEIKSLLLHADKAFTTWEKIWSKFVSAPVKEEILYLVNKLNDLKCYSYGGYINSERNRICFSRVSQNGSQNEDLSPFKGISIEGNFLFDRAEKVDFLNVIVSIGISPCEIGDIWIHRDRGAQAICTPEAAKTLHSKRRSIRNIEIVFEALEINQLALPANRQPRRIKSVEASKRLDAIASAGFGLSRGKIIKQIKSGQLRLNWVSIKQASKSLTTGDKVQLEGKGSIEVLSLEQTNRGRWRVELLRH